MNRKEVTIGTRVVVCNGGRHQGYVGVVDAIKDCRAGVLIGRSRLWFNLSELCLVQ